MSLPPDLPDPEAPAPTIWAARKVWPEDPAPQGNRMIAAVLLLVGIVLTLAAIAWVLP